MTALNFKHLFLCATLVGCHEKEIPTEHEVNNFTINLYTAMDTAQSLGASSCPKNVENLVSQNASLEIINNKGQRATLNKSGIVDYFCDAKNRTSAQRQTNNATINKETDIATILVQEKVGNTTRTDFIVTGTENGKIQLQNGVSYCY